MGVSLRLCIFAPDTFTFVGVTTLSLEQGDQVLDILAADDETPVQESCSGDSCVVEISFDDSVYQAEETSATVSGVAALDHDGRRQLAVRAELDFMTEITFETTTTDIVDDGNNNDGNQVDNLSDNGRRGNGSRKVAWLFPLLAVICVAFICVIIVVRKRRNQQQASQASRTSTV